MSEQATSGTRGRETFPDLAEVVLVVVVRWRLIAITALAAALVGIVHAMTATPEYVARSSFTVADTRSTGSLGLGALAGQFSGGLAALAGPSSAQFLRSALTSRDVLDRLLVRPIPLLRGSTSVQGRVADGDSVDLLAWYHVEGGERPLAIEDGRRALTGALQTAVGDRTGIVTLQVKDRDPRVAASIAASLITALDRFNLETRQSSSRANRQFLERRVREAQQELRDVEDQMRDFLMRNRRVSDSPGLQYEEARIQRQIAVRQQVYLSLAQDLEQARIDEVKDTPVLTVIEAPSPPARRNWPRRKLLVGVWLVAGVVTGVGFAFLQDWMRAMDRRASPSWVELRARIRRIPWGRG